MNDKALTPAAAFEPRHLRRMLQFAGAYRQPEIVVTLSRKLSCRRRRVVLPLEVEQLKRHQDSITVAKHRTELQHEAGIQQKPHAALLKVRERMTRHGALSEGEKDE